MPTVPFSFSCQNAMSYEKEIIKTLYEAGTDGLSVHKIAIHVYNAHNTLFSPIAFEKVRQYVQVWLLRNSRFSDSPVIHCDKRGTYRINRYSEKARQTILNFNDTDSFCNDNTTKPASNSCGKQPLLFDPADE